MTVRATPESAVEVLEVGEEEVVLDVPESIADCDRVIPKDAIEFGDEAGAWFAWDLDEKQPRAPHDGYAGTVQWGRDNVSWDNRPGATYGDVVDTLNGCINGYCDESWRWRDGEDPRPLYPMLIIPHADFSPEPGLMLIDLDDVVKVRDDGTAVLTREAWDIIQSFDAYAELSLSMTGVHVLVRGEFPEFVDAKKIIEDLDAVGQCEIYGYPGNGRIIGTTWAHIDGTPPEIPHNQDAIDALADRLIDKDEQLSAREQAQRAAEDHRDDADTLTGSSGSGNPYFDLNVEAIANTGPFRTHGSSGRGPHPAHGGTSTPDADSTNFAVSRSDGWTCWAHDDGGGALQLIAVLEGIRDCGSARDVMSDPVDALRTCLAARDEYAGSELDGETPPTAALKGVLQVQGIEPRETDSGMLPRAQYEAAREMYEQMGFTG